MRIAKILLRMAIVTVALVRIAAGQTTEKVLYQFAGISNGAVSSVIHDSAGNLYGETSAGGSGGAGTVFKVDPTGNETILYNFTGDPITSDGGYPTGGLVMDRAGNLYGITFSGGGSHGGGTVFKVTPAGNLTYLYMFSNFPGSPYSPEAGLIIDGAGNLYGTTFAGGATGSCLCGSVFKLDPTGKLTVLYSFTGTGGDGTNPQGALVMDSAGNLYGTTLNGGTAGNGTVFKVTPTGVETVLYSFAGTSGDGANPQGALVRDSAGNVYGTTLNGGTAGNGTVFRVDSTGLETVLHSFAGTNGDGANPEAGLIGDSAGNLYGTTVSGGTAGYGIVFKVDSTGLETVLHSFTGTNGDGSQPLASLMQDSAGNLYGTTWLGGASGGGAIFKLNPASQETVLFSFAGLNGDGVSPKAGLIADSAGNLYGTTWLGGAFNNNAGSVFKLDPASKETVLYRFEQMSQGDGFQPQAGLIQDSAGNLYGTTSGSGFGFGTVFKLDPAGHETVLHNFAGTTDGSKPLAGLIMDSAGNLYGTASGSGGPGNVFKLDPTGNFTVFYTFTGGNGDGSDPQGDLIMDGAGNLYGTTTAGGVRNCGTVFRVDPTGHETLLYSFTGTNGDGCSPQAGLIRSGVGDFYGTTASGGVINRGTIFVLTGTALPPDFSLSASPSSQTVVQGAGTSYTATVTPSGGFTGTVAFTVSGLPSGAAGTFNPTSVVGSGTSTLTLTTATSTPAGTYALTITGSSGSLVHSTTVTLVVNPVPSDFSIAASPSSQSISQGNTGTYKVTITPTGGFTGTVAFTVSGLPSGAAGTFNPTSVAGSGTSTLTLTTAASTPAGTYPLTITGSSGSLVHSITVTLVVPPNPQPPPPTGLSVTTVAKTTNSDGTVTIIAQYQDKPGYLTKFQIAQLYPYKVVKSGSLSNSSGQYAVSYVGPMSGQGYFNVCDSTGKCVSAYAK